jgi:hypothetical protein
VFVCFTIALCLTSSLYLDKCLSRPALRGYPTSRWVNDTPQFLCHIGCRCTSSCTSQITIKNKTQRSWTVTARSPRSWRNWSDQITDLTIEINFVFYNLTEHVIDTNHRILWNESQVIGHESHWKARKFKEASEIYRGGDMIISSLSFDIHPICLPLIRNINFGIQSKIT